MPFAGYADWKATQTYTIGDVVYYKTYLYVAMTDCDAGDNPLTATYTEYFGVGDFGFDKIFPTEEEPYPDNTYSQTMRKWTIFDLPFGYYYSRLCGFPGNRFQGSDFANVGTEVMVVNVYRPEGPQGPEPEDPKLKYNWSGYGIKHGLNSEWPESEIGELVYHISFVPLEASGPESIMPLISGDETVSGLSFQSHLYQENTSTFFIGDSQYGGSAGLIRALTMYYATFSRTHNYTGNPSGSASISSPAFADNYVANIPELPVTDPPTYWTLTGISPDHPD